MPSPRPTSPVWRPGSLGRVGDPPRVRTKCSDRRGKGNRPTRGTHWHGGKRGAEDRAATAQKRPRGGGEPGRGLPAEGGGTATCAGASAGRDSTASRARARPLTREDCRSPHPPPAGPGPGALGSDKPGGPTADTGSALGGLPVVPSDRPSPQGRGSPPCHLTHTCQAGGRPQPHAVGRREELGPGRGPRPRPDREDGPLQPSTSRAPALRGAHFRLQTPARSGQAGPPLPEGGVLKMARSSPKVGTPPDGLPLLTPGSQ